MTEAKQPQAFPFFHSKTPYAGECSKAAAQYDKLLVVWNQVGDVLKTQPPCTVARICDIHTGHAYLMMASIDGELVLFWTPSLDVTSIWTPEYGEDRNADDYNFMRVGLEQWLSNPVFAEPVDPAAIKAGWKKEFGVEATEQWVWSDSAPAEALSTYTVFCRQMNGVGTTYIGAVEARDLESATQAGIEQCSGEWGDYPIEKIHCLGVVEGSINVLHWDDQVE